MTLALSRDLYGAMANLLLWGTRHGQPMSRIITIPGVTLKIV